jgi:hypothetical protein
MPPHIAFLFAHPNADAVNPFACGQRFVTDSQSSLFDERRQIAMGDERSLHILFYAVCIA